MDATTPRLGTPFANGKLRAKAPDMIVIHESVTVSRADCERVLRRRGLGVHVIIDEHAQVWLYDDARASALAHAGKLNTRSIGVELINPYYPDAAASSPLWKDRPVHRERWAHKGRYVVPTPEALEALYQLCAQLCAEHGIPCRVVSSPEPGILAHAHSPHDSHSDGVAPAEYIAARIQGLSPEQAFAALREY